LIPRSDIGTFILDFQSTNFAADSKILLDVLHVHQMSLNNSKHEFKIQELFVLDPPVLSAGWAFAKLFIAGQFIEKLYMRYFEEIEKSKGKKFEDRFVSWLSGELYSKNCLARIKIAQEMRI
jgi:hypothetical protein